MARPKKSIPPAKNREIKIRFTEELYNVLTNEALAARIPRTEYIRQLILDHHPVIKQEVVFDCTKVLEIFRGLGNCRGNLCRFRYGKRESFVTAGNFSLVC